jgi:hypothetical protein
MLGAIPPFQYGYRYDIGPAPALAPWMPISLDTQNRLTVVAAFLTAQLGADIAAIHELQLASLVELRVLSQLLAAGFNISDDLDRLRADQVRPRDTPTLY